MNDNEEPITQRLKDTPFVDRDAYTDDGLPGVPLSVLVFACAEHDEETIVDYYDPDDPPRCSHGDLMTRKAR